MQVTHLHEAFQEHLMCMDFEGMIRLLSVHWLCHHTRTACGLTRVWGPALLIVHVSLAIAGGPKQGVKLVVLHIDGHAPPILMPQACNTAYGLLGLSGHSQGVDIIPKLGAYTCIRLLHMVGRL